MVLLERWCPWPRARSLLSPAHKASLHSSCWEHGGTFNTSGQSWSPRHEIYHLPSFLALPSISQGCHVNLQP